MRKIIFLIPIIIAYALILGHNLIPHVHHSSKQETKHDHHHSNQAHHNHESADSDDENESLPDLFAHFMHSPFTVNIEHTLVLADEGKELNKIQQDVFVIEDNVSSKIFLDKRELPPDVRQWFYSNYSNRHSSLRAPPVC